MRVPKLTTLVRLPSSLSIRSFGQKAADHPTRSAGARVAERPAIPGQARRRQRCDAATKALPRERVAGVEVHDTVGWTPLPIMTSSSETRPGLVQSERRDHDGTDALGDWIRGRRPYRPITAVGRPSRWSYYWTSGPMPLAGFGQGRDDAVCAARGDAKRGGDVASAHPGVVGDAQQGPSMVGEEAPLPP
jgi:hypothetical protein